MSRRPILLALLAIALGAQHVPAQGPGPRSRDAWPGGGRSALDLTDAQWRKVLAGVGRPESGLGYSSEEMAFYGRDRALMRTVANLFGDVRAVARFSGAKAEQLLAAAPRPAALVEQAFLLTDIASGRNLPLPDPASWGVEWIPAGAAPVDALMPILSYSLPGTGGPSGSAATGSIAASDWEQWYRLPEPVQRLVARLFVGAAEATPWIAAAYDRPFLERAVWGEEDMRAAGGASPAYGPLAWIREAYAFATAPWVEERLGQLATRRADALAAIESVDRDYLAFGSAILFAHVQRALDEYLAQPPRAATPSASFTGCAFDTDLGRIRILGPGPDEVREPAFLTLDLGGDDVYRGRHAVPAGLDRPVALLIDLAGDDTYDGGRLPAAMACGLFGVGAIFDLQGDDRYRVRESGLGAGWFGVGLLVDYRGDDRYVVDQRWGQGSAHVGVGLLADLEGDDEYICGYESQGLGSTLGAGVLVDASGNDRYIARDDGNISELYNGQSVSMAQGCGYGRRADLGDGHSLAGGFGVLVDGAGDDRYHATAWSQGAGYWWGVGILEDLGGNDTYRNGKYSLGAAAHFAIGCQVDLSGDDLYNVGNPQAVNQYQGHARDGSIGISIDGDGDDQYLLRSHCGGSGDLGSIGFFWDRRGADTYHIDYAPPEEPGGWNDTPPLGTTTRYGPFRSFRDDLATYGIFLDSGGADRYLWPEGPARNGRTWRSRRGDRLWGWGRDAAWY
ncbi:MAG: hypothetical protein FJY75_00860 [Candidatus Eisenbacteria bacterium]|uniref:Uncharacterized protein n=1 Tax=Eiseniibacteriota bacterium TaxID=2212470 RepID=A0A937XAJ3_UNCEI|nr:hypothetical protein [Candidatus Eisenbacteria bacterium]